MKDKKLQVALPLIFSGVLIVGMWLGYKMNKTGSSGGFFKAPQSSAVQEAVNLINEKYVDSVNVDTLQQLAIEKIISGLDPHSLYLPPVELAAANEDLAASFEGIGVEFNVFSDTINIVYVVPEGPSEKAGIVIGDKILSVNDTNTAGKKLTTKAIRDLIKGQRGTKAKLLLLRPTGKLETIYVTRGNIAVSPIEAAYMMDNITGYIKLGKFSENSYEDFMKNLELLKKQGLKKLIFDLRGNGGGYMNDAVEIVDEFLSGTRLIVYTQGEHNKKNEFRCKRPGIFEEGELVVMIDEHSASASEVVAGALQDWDRATIIGRRSFGKGLVQEQFQLSDGSAVRLTVARYYTPLGRSIQKPYSNGRRMYQEELFERYSNGELLHADSAKFMNGQVFTTPAGHKLFGGGGIMPDIFTPIDTTLLGNKINILLSSGSVNSFGYLYFAKNKTVLTRVKNINEFITYLQPRENELWNQFILQNTTDSISTQVSVNPQQRKEITQYLIAHIARYIWRNNGFYQTINLHDKDVQAAYTTVLKK